MTDDEIGEIMPDLIEHCEIARMEAMNKVVAALADAQSGSLN
jgi:hypothetical protein